MSLLFPGPRKGEEWTDDERRMATFFHKVAALVLGFLAVLGLLLWLLVQYAC